MEPYQEVFVHELDHTHTRVAISGTVLSRDDTSFVLDDGTGSITIAAMDQLIPSADYLRVYGTVIPSDAGYQLQADLIQDLSGIDKIAHKKVKEKLRKA